MDDIKALPKNPPTNAAAEREREYPRKEPNLDRAIDDETGGRIHPSNDDVRTEKRPDDDRDR